MQINLSGHHVDITKGIKEQVNSKLNKIAKRYPSLIAANVILGNERNKHTVEINTSYEGASISANGAENNLFSAIAATCKKLDAALSHRKGLLKAKQHNKPPVVEQQPQIVEQGLPELDIDVDLTEYEQAS